MYVDNPFDVNENASDSKTSLIPPYSHSQSSVSQVQSHNESPPPWLTNEMSSQVPPPPGSIAAQGSMPYAVPFTIEAETPAIDPDVPRMITYTRVINVVLSVCMILISLLSLLTTVSLTTGVLASYVVVFSCLLCCFETHLKQISKFIAFNFGFMYSAKSRSVFMIFVGTILFSFSLFGKIIGACMLANAGFNIYVLIKYPQYDDAQRKDAQSEITDYLAANPAFAQQFVNIGVKTGAEVLASNPGLAKQASDAYFRSHVPPHAENQASV